MSDQITRKDIITDDALKWGEDYVNYLEKAIAKNKEFVSSIKAVNDANGKGRGAENFKEFTEEQKKASIAAVQANAAFKEQLKLEDALAKAKVKSTLATSEENKELVRQKMIASETTKAVKQGIQEETSAYAKLNNARTEAKKKLLDLVAAEGLQSEAVKKSQLEFDSLDKKVKEADHAAQDYSKSVGKYPGTFARAGEAAGNFGGVIGEVARNAIGFARSGEEVAGVVTDMAKNLTTSARAAIGYVTQTMASVTANEALTVSQTQAAVSSGELAAAEGAEAVVMETSVAATESATIATFGLTAATWLLAAPITAVIAIVVLLVSGLTKLDSVMDGFEQMTAAFGGGFSKASEIVTDFFTHIISVGDAVSKLGNFLAHPIDSIKSFSKEIGKAADNASKLKAAEQDLEDLTGIFDARNRNIESEIKQDQIRLKNKKLNGDQIEAIENRINNNFDNLTKNKVKIEKDGLELSLRNVLDNNARLTKAEKAKLAQSIRAGDVEVATNLLNNDKISGADLDRLKKTVESVANVNNQLGEQQERIIDKNNKASDKADARKAAADAKAAKREEERLKRLEAMQKATYELDKQTLDYAIESQNEIVKNEKLSDDDRVKALNELNDKQVDLAFLNRKNQLSQAGLTAQDKLRIDEQYSHDVIAIQMTTAKQLEKIQEFDIKAYEDQLKLKATLLDTDEANAIAKEEERFKIMSDLGFKDDKAKEKAEIEHQKNLFNIKKDFMTQAAQLQLDETVKILEDYKAQSDGSIESKQKIADYEKKIADQRQKIAEISNTAFKEDSKKQEESTKQSVEKYAKYATEGLNIVGDLASSISANKIAKLEEEGQKQDEYYAKQLELAGNDDVKKKEIEKEQALRKDELTKKINKEKEKQAKFDKAQAIAQIAIQTALAIVKAAPNPVEVVFASVIGAIALAKAIATPLPKYKMGRKGGKAEIAVVGDGGVNEIVTDSKGNNPILTPDTDTVMSLNQGDIVHKSMADYNAFKLAQLKKLGGVSASKADKELLLEMRLTRKAIEKQKMNVNVQTNKIDVGHLVWSAGQRRW